MVLISYTFTSGVGGGGTVGAREPPKVLICWKHGQNLWKFGQNPWNPNKIPKYLAKIPEHLGKNGAHHSLTSNMTSNICTKTSEDHLLKVTPIGVCEGILLGGAEKICPENNNLP